VGDGSDGKRCSDRLAETLMGAHTPFSRAISQRFVLLFVSLEMGSDQYL
jgi:hypothetical protein